MDMASAGSPSSTSEKTKDLLVHHASRLFAEAGFHGTSVKVIAEAAGVNISLISYHFGGKEGLFRYCLEQFAKDRLMMAERYLIPPKSLDELRVRLMIFAEEFLDCHFSNPEISTILLTEMTRNFVLAGDKFQQFFIKNFQKVAEFFGESQKSGLLRPDIDAVMLVAQFMGALLHLVKTKEIALTLFKVDVAERDIRKSYSDQLIRVFIEGMINHDKAAEK